MTNIILLLIKVYQKTLSHIPRSLNSYLGCRFYPTCSDYTYQAIEKYGILKGLIKGFKRIIKCHPFNKGGHDPC